MLNKNSSNFTHYTQASAETISQISQRLLPPMSCSIHFSPYLSTICIRAIENIVKLNISRYSELPKPRKWIILLAISKLSTALAGKGNCKSVSLQATTFHSSPHHYTELSNQLHYMAPFPRWNICRHPFSGRICLSHSQSGNVTRNIPKQFLNPVAIRLRQSSILTCFSFKNVCHCWHVGRIHYLQTAFLWWLS
jgi:hypothetical protein